MSRGDDLPKGHGKPNEEEDHELSPNSNQRTEERAPLWCAEDISVNEFPSYNDDSERVVATIWPNDQEFRRDRTTTKRKWGYHSLLCHHQILWTLYNGRSLPSAHEEGSQPRTQTRERREQKSSEWRANGSPIRGGTFAHFSHSPTVVQSECPLGATSQRRRTQPFRHLLTRRKTEVKEVSEL